MDKKLHLVAAIAAVCLAVTCGWYRGWEASDFYPIYYGASGLRHGESPYSPEAASHLASTWIPAVQKQAVPVIAYPLPVLVFFSPLTLFPLGIANLIWIAIAVYIIVASLGRAGVQYALLPFCFLPFYQALWVQNLSLFWCALSILVLERKCPPVLLGLCLAILPFKPQEGLLVAAYGLWRSRSDSKITASFVAAFAALLLSSYLCLPGWVGEWFVALQDYRRQTNAAWLWFLGVVFFLPRIPSEVRAVGLQVLLFPINDIYRALLLLYGWRRVAMPARLLMFTSFLSLMWFPAYNTPLTLLVCMLLPFLAVILSLSLGLTRAVVASGVPAPGR